MVSKLKLQEVLGLSLFVAFGSHLHFFFSACMDAFASPCKTGLHAREGVGKLDKHCLTCFLIA